MKLNEGKRNFWNYEQQACQYRKIAIKRKMLLLMMIEVTLFELNPRSQWLGDYAKVSKD